MYAMSQRSCRHEIALLSVLIFAHVCPSLSNSGLFNWMAGIYGPCCNGTDVSPYQQRTVECYSLLEARSVGDSECNHLPKPCSWRACSCSAVACVTACSGTLEACSTTVPGASDQARVQPIGCLPDTYRSQVLLDEFDSTCASCTGTAPCASGLPFYRMVFDIAAVGGQDGFPEACLGFCTSKGFDVGGAVASADGLYGGECRCGASVLNTAIFANAIAFGGYSEPRQCLLFDFAVMTDIADGACEVSVFHFTGSYDGQGIPFEDMSNTEKDTQYRERMVMGTDIEFDLPSNSTEEPGLMDMMPGFNRNCWPSNCGPGLGPWAVRSSSPLSGDDDPYAEYVKVRYAYDPNIDATRKQAFQEAVRRWRDATCIEFVEEGDVEEPATYDLRVSNQQGSCHVVGLGNSKAFSEVQVSVLNMGWCSGMLHVGSIIHELGHVLGMNHEQKRPDATLDYWGHGPFLTVYWETIESRWEQQWVPAQTSYTGSADDGPADPFVGIAEYDYDSIMHYALWHFADAVNPTVDPGQRQRLSEGDIRQIHDMYQCVPKDSPVPSTTTRTPASNPEGEAIFNIDPYCPWLISHTEPHTYLCVDGTPCVGDYCCQSHGGCAKCPASRPRMCAEMSCGDDYCCATDCNWLGLRSCGAPAACPWLLPTDKEDMFECMDGTRCYGVECCSANGGRAKCPMNLPIMCAHRTCGSANTGDALMSHDHCCAQDCSVSGGPRPCYVDPKEYLRVGGAWRQHALSAVWILLVRIATAL